MYSLKRLLSLDNISFGFLLGIVVLLPLVFTPIDNISIDVSKSFFLSVITLASLVFYLIGRLADGVFLFPKNYLLIGLILIPLIFLITSLLSPVPTVSIFGQGFEVGTFSFILIATLLAFLASSSVNSRDKVLKLYAGFVAAFIILAVYHLIRLFAGPGIMSFGIFNSELSSLIGKWNDLAIFLGFIVILILFTLEFISVSFRPLLIKALLSLALAIALFLLAVINFTFVWIVLAVISSIIFVYRVYENTYVNKIRTQQVLNENPPEDHILTSQDYRVPFFSLFAFLVSLFFVFTSSTLGSSISSYFNVTQVEVRPSWDSTYDIAVKTLAENPLIGSGPNRFGNVWSLYKPDALNPTIFWATDFNTGVGLIPTFAVTTGIPGIVAWLIFFGLFLYSGWRAVINFGLSRISQYFVLSSFLLSAYLWAVAIFYVPGVVIFSFAFLLTGIFIAVLTIEGLVERREFIMINNPKVGFVSTLGLIFGIAASAAFAYFSVERLLSIKSFQRGISSVNIAGNIDKAEAEFLSAARLNESDLYYRGLSQLAVSRLNQLLQQQNVNAEEARSRFQLYLGNAIDNGRRAVDYDETNYVNWINMGSIYEAVVPLNITGAYEEAIKAYDKAKELAPKNPLVYFVKARLEVAKRDLKAAREALNQAIALKSNYTEALFLLSQIEASEGNIDVAIAKAEEASLLAPNDVGLFFQLGLLKYTNRDYPGAILALERAVAITPDYSNAKYFLGLSYERVGRKADAIAEFERILELNPGNKEVENIIANLRANRSPFANVPPPNNAPEKKKSPPIPEKSIGVDDF